MGQRSYRIDILQHIDDVDFDDAWTNRVDTIDGDVTVHVISREELIRNKLSCGRPRDLLDVEELIQSRS
jgi:hypothetical protein